MKKKLDVGDMVNVKIPDGLGGWEHTAGKIRRIGAKAEGSFRMATLDVRGIAMYCAVHETELSDG